VASGRIPWGGELRCLADGEMLGTRHRATETELLDASDVWKAAFRRRGKADDVK
jgi:hypothetical protein